MACLVCGGTAYGRQFCSEDCYREYQQQDIDFSQNGECEECGHYIEHDLQDIETTDCRPMKVCGLCLQSAEFDDDGYLILKGETVHESINISQDHGYRPVRVA